MSEWLLTKEEVLRIWDTSSNGLTWGEYADVIAKAQAKKMARLFRENCDNCNHWRPVYHFTMSSKVWEALNKEIKDG